MSDHLLTGSQRVRQVGDLDGLIREDQVLRQALRDEAVRQGVAPDEAEPTSDTVHLFERLRAELESQIGVESGGVAAAAA